MKNLKLILTLSLICLGIINANAQRSIYEPINISDVKFSFGDFGSMWTYDAVPLDVYEKELGFRPSKKWLLDVQKSALQLGNGCSASFVSRDGLIMTNHHCVRGMLQSVEHEGENIHKDGFYAKTLKQERRIPNLFVDRLLEIKDVSDQIHNAMDKASNEVEAIEVKNKLIKDIEAKFSESTGNVAKVITLYNGGKYSLYIYERFDDIRLVMAPDVQIAATGWDWDNFTYPRYELDFAFLRAYDKNGKPVVTDNYFKWSKNGAEENEAVFVSGRPGNTDRLLSMAELEYFRDFKYKIILHRLNEAYTAYYEYFMAHPDKQAKLLSKLLSVSNGRKAYAGMLMGLNDDYLMAKKYDFEKNLKQEVFSNKSLNQEYQNIWKDIKEVLGKIQNLEEKSIVLRMSHYYSSSYQATAYRLVSSVLSGRRSTNIDDVFVPSTEQELDMLLLAAQQRFLYKTKGKDCKYLQTLFGGKTGQAAAEYLLKSTVIDDKSSVEKLMSITKAELKKLDDPFIQYAVNEYELSQKQADEMKQLYNKLSVLNQKLGLLIYKVYGSKIPPDATSSLRISHGKIKGYEYNGTLAPAKVTYYGLWDRYFSFGKKSYPWGLHERWQKIPKKLDLQTAIGFASTNDIVGGNSGSAVINKNAEIVGIVHDGNLESLVGSFAYLGEDNRSVATDSKGLMEALKLVYKTPRLVKELETGKLK